MNTPKKIVLAGGIVCIAILGYLILRAPARLYSPSEVQAVTLSPAPPAPPDCDKVSALPDPPRDGIVFDLRYKVQTGAPDDIQYHSYWGFGITSDPDGPFIREVRKQSTNKLFVVHNDLLPGRQSAAIEYKGNTVHAFYFDLNADGKFAENERILPTTQAGTYSVDFITPDFRLRKAGGSLEQEGALFRVLLQVSFSGGQPNCMWSPAAVLHGTATMDGKNAQLVLFANGFEGSFTTFGSSRFALLFPETSTNLPRYFVQQTLSSVVRCGDRLYRLSFQGERASGHPARAVLTPDTSPTGTLAINLTGTEPLRCALDNVYVQGEDDKTVFLMLTDPKQQLPAGRYSLVRGGISYGKTNEMEWHVSFTKGPIVAIEPGKLVEQVINEPKLLVRAVNEMERYSRDVKETSSFKKGTRIYLEPRIVAKNQTVLTMFTRERGASKQSIDVPPDLLITTPDGKRIHSQTMEYG